MTRTLTAIQKRDLRAAQLDCLSARAAYQAMLARRDELAPAMLPAVPDTDPTDETFAAYCEAEEALDRLVGWNAAASAMHAAEARLIEVAQPISLALVKTDTQRKAVITVFSPNALNNIGTRRKLLDLCLRLSPR